MALISIIKYFHPHNYAKLLDKAAELAPPLHHSIAEPVGGFKLKERYSLLKRRLQGVCSLSFAHKSTS